MAATRTRIETGDVVIARDLYAWVTDCPILLLALHAALIKHQRGLFGLIDSTEDALNRAHMYREGQDLTPAETYQHRGPVMSLWNVGDLLVSITTSTDRTDTRIAFHEKDCPPDPARPGPCLSPLGGRGGRLHPDPSRSTRP